jgi:hypothetical protein
METLVEESVDLAQTPPGTVAASKGLALSPVPGRLTCVTNHSSRPDATGDGGCEQNKIEKGRPEQFPSLPCCGTGDTGDLVLQPYFR